MRLVPEEEQTDGATAASARTGHGGQQWRGGHFVSPGLGHHSYGSHMTRMAANGFSTAGDWVRLRLILLLPEKLSLPDATATCDDNK